MRSILAALAVVVCAAPAAAATIELWNIQGKTFYANGRLQKAGPVTFSTQVSPDHPDGFELIMGGAYNYYGEDNEFIDFDAPVYLNSIDFGHMGDVFGLPIPTTLSLHLFDVSSMLLNTITLSALTASGSTFAIDTNDVSRVVFDFTGGTDFFGDGRNHAWYLMNNITYSDAVETAPEVPEPASLTLLVTGSAALYARLRRRSDNHEQ